jgi:hypothetical protein
VILLYEISIIGIVLTVRRANDDEDDEG